MSGSNVWSRSRERMRVFSEHFAQCAEEQKMVQYHFRPLGSTDSSLLICPKKPPLLGLTLSQDGLLLWSSEHAAYGKCVAATTTSKQELKKDLCAQEFQALKTCFTNAAKKRAK